MEMLKRLGRDTVYDIVQNLHLDMYESITVNMP